MAHFFIIITFNWHITSYAYLWETMWYFDACIHCVVIKIGVISIWVTSSIYHFSTVNTLTKLPCSYFWNIRNAVNYIYVLGQQNTHSFFLFVTVYPLTNLYPTLFPVSGNHYSILCLYKSTLIPSSQAPKVQFGRLLTYTHSYTEDSKTIPRKWPLLPVITHILEGKCSK